MPLNSAVEFERQNGKVEINPTNGAWPGAFRLALDD
jgi:hypothetical protein